MRGLWGVRWAVCVGRVVVVALVVALVVSVSAGVPGAGGAFAQSAERQVVKAYVPTNFPPYYELDADGAPSGFAIDVMNAVAARADVDVTYIPTPYWPDVINSLINGKGDIVPTMGVTAERHWFASFTPPMQTYSVSIFVRANSSNIDGMADLAGRRVAVAVRNVGANLMKEHDEVELVEFPDSINALFALLSGEVDAFVYPEPVTWRTARQAGVDERIKTVGAPLAEFKRAIAVRKGRADLHKRLSEAVTAFVRTPAYQELYVKWFGKPQPYWTERRIRVALTTGGAALFVFGAILIVLWGLNRRLSLAKAEAEQANLAKTRFLAAASHDLRQPLQAMQLYLGILREKHDEPDHREVLEGLQESADSLGGLLDSLLDVSRLDAELIVPDVHETPLAPIMTRLCHEFEPTAETQGTALRCLPARVNVMTDPNLLESVLMNLLSNALKHTQDGRVLFGVRRGGDHVWIEVWDTGSGIPEDQLGEIFVEFVQLGNEARDRKKGLGLGLSIVERLARLMDHPLDVRSSVGRGSVFRIRVPLATGGA